MGSDRYNIILADPPWRHSSTRGEGSRRAAERKYPTMSTAEICALDMQFGPVTEPIARLFLWCTDSMMDDARKVMAAWGFRYTKVAFVWVKTSKRPLTDRAAGIKKAAGEPVIYTDENGPPRGLVFGAGRTTRNGAELCLLGSRGSMPVADKSQRQVIIAPVAEHSRKPDEAYERIEAMFPTGKYLELFARRRRPRWSAWGNEI